MKKTRLTMKVMKKNKITFVSFMEKIQVKKCRSQLKGFLKLPDIQLGFD